MTANLPIRSLVPVFKGAGSWVPGIQQLLYAPAGGETHSARYCYGVWLKHLCLLWQYGMQQVPRSVVEIGPGNSVGTGYAARLSGAVRYVGVDCVRHADSETNATVLPELIRLFEMRAPRPRKGWPDFDHCLDAKLFPSHILTPEHLEGTLDPARVERLAAGEGVYYRLWKEELPIPPASVDLAFSHTVLNHVDDLDTVHAETARWLKPGGWVSHQVDLTCMHTTPEWNGHLRFDERLWSVVRGRRAFYVNRMRASERLARLERHGLQVVAAMHNQRLDGLPAHKLAARFRAMPAEDLRCCGLFVIARKAPG